MREVIEVLTRHVSRLEAELEAAKAAQALASAQAADRDVVAAQVEALRTAVQAMEAALAVERERRADVERDRDAWRAAATRPWWRRLTG